MESAIQGLTGEELLNLSAVDNEFYSQYWFPRTFRQGSAPFHPQIWRALETPEIRHIGCEVFRGGAKTTLLRAFTSKRVAFAASRTILYVSAAQDHAKRSVMWLRRQVLFNKPWAEFFQLRIGSKKSDEWLEVYHGVDDTPITIVAIGITGQNRGLNIDDYRPDLIVIDDPCDEENTATPEQRKKVEDLVFGALDKSLAPPTEAQDAKMVLLQTSLQGQDLINECHRDPHWTTFKFSCFDEHERSTWEARFPTEFLKKEKDAHRSKNRLPLWYREMECKIIAEELSVFRAEWAKPWPGGVLPEGGVHFLYIDPVPPPSEREEQMGLLKKDFEVHTVVKYIKGDVYVCEQRRKKGHTPEWSVMTFWELVDKWDVKMFESEPVAYQRTLKWIIEKSMEQRGRYVQAYVPPGNKQDRRKKSIRIIDTLTGVASQGHWYLNLETQGPLYDQFLSYPNVAKDDDIDSASGATKLALEHGPDMEGWDLFEEYEVDGVEVQRPAQGYCP